MDSAKFFGVSLFCKCLSSFSFNSFSRFTRSFYIKWGNWSSLNLHIFWHISHISLVIVKFVHFIQIKKFCCTMQKQNGKMDGAAKLFSMMQTEKKLSLLLHTLLIE